MLTIRLNVGSSAVVVGCRLSVGRSAEVHGLTVYYTRSGDDSSVYFSNGLEFGMVEGWIRVEIEIQYGI